MIDRSTRGQGLTNVELWIHLLGNPKHCKRVMEDTSYANSIEIYLERCRGDVWTLEMKDRRSAGYRSGSRAVPERSQKEDLHRGGESSGVAGRTGQKNVACGIRKALKYIPAATDRGPALHYWAAGCRSRSSRL